MAFVRSKSNPVPKMIHPLGRAWQQPDPKQMMFGDDKSVIMSKAVFDKLLDYSNSQPTGVYEGKMWKAEWKDKLDIIHWELRFFDYCDQLSKRGEVQCVTRSYEIILID